MILLLRILGVLTVLGGFAGGAMSARALRWTAGAEPMTAFITWVLAGAASSIIWFALAQILAEQAVASHEREEIYQLLKRRTTE